MAGVPAAGSRSSHPENIPDPKRRRTSAATDAAGCEASAEAPEICHVLAFGDSLTYGGFGSRSYPDQLEEMLNRHGGSSKRYKVHNTGVCGESTEDMVDRLGEELKHFADENIQLSFVLVLGGTNDLGHLTPQEILANLAKMRATIAKINARCVALTIPRDEFGLGPVARIVNKGLRSEASKEGGPLLADVSVVPEEHLSDGVHFDSEGYAKFAQLAFDVMRPAL